MRLANYANRATAVLGDAGAERSRAIANACGGRFGPDIAAVYAVWDEFISWSMTLVDVTVDSDLQLDRSKLRPPSPRPRQVFAIGLNYDAHAAESGFAAPTDPPSVFAKYVSSFSGPDTTVVMPSGRTSPSVSLNFAVQQRSSASARAMPAPAANHNASVSLENTSTPGSKASVNCIRSS